MESFYGCFLPESGFKNRQTKSYTAIKILAKKLQPANLPKQGKANNILLGEKPIIQ